MEAPPEASDAAPSPPAGDTFDGLDSSGVDSPEWLLELEQSSRWEGKSIPVWCLVFRLNPPMTDINGDGVKTGYENRVPEECRTILELIAKAKITIEHFFSRDQDEIFIKLSMVEDVCVDEATNHMQIPMPLKWWNPETEEIDETGKEMQGTCIFNVQIQDKFVRARPDFLFPSGIQQRLLMNRLLRYAGPVPDRIKTPSRVQLLKEAERYASKGNRMQVYALQMLVEAFGCSSGDTETAQGVRKRLPKASAAHDKWSQMVMSVKVGVEEFEDVLLELRARQNDDDNLETASWVTDGSLLECYPLHCEEELEFLKQNWGSFAWIRPGLYREADPRAREGHEGHKWFRPHYQPLDHVRRYFGEHVALYFAWLGLYTRFLAYPMFLGVLTMTGYDIWGDDNNRFALPYSCFLSLWSTVFLESWTRTENDLKFRWGSEGSEQTEEPRPQFRGMLHKSEETGLSKMIHKTGVSFYKRQGRITISWLMSFGMILATSSAALNAYLVREIGKGGNRNYTATDCGRLRGCDLGMHPVNMTVNGTGEFIFDEDGEYVTEEIENVCVPYYETYGDVPRTEPDEEDPFGLPMYYVDNIRTDTATGMGNIRCLAGTIGKPRIHCPVHGGVFDELEGCRLPSKWDSNKFKWGSSFVSLICIQIASRTYKPMAVKLTDWENHRTQTEYDDSLIVKNFMFEFINNYFTLFFIAFLMGNIDIPFKGLWDNVSETAGAGLFPDEMTPCQNNKGETMTSCMGILQRQLFVVFTSKQTASLIKQWNKPKRAAAARVSKENAEIAKKNKLRAEGFKYPMTLDNPVEAEKFLAPYESNFDDFKEMSIQFGYATLFAVSYPLAALLAWFNNLIEMRLDAYQLCYMHRRADWRQQEDIGSWASVFQTISVINVMTNACLVGFVGSQVARMVSDDPEQTDTFLGRFTMWQMWLVVVLAEHGSFSIKFLIKMVAPSMPEYIDDAREALQLRQGDKGDLKLDRTTVHVLPELQLKAPMEKKEHSYMTANPVAKKSKGPERTKSAKEEEEEEAEKLQVLWKTVDKDCSGALDKEEIGIVMKDMGKEMEGAELDAAMNAIDLDGSGEVEYEEFLAWWQAQDPEAQKQLMMLNEMNFDDL